MLKKCGKRSSHLFVHGLGQGGRSAAIAYTLLETAKLNGIDPQAWLTDVLSRIANHKLASGANAYRDGWPGAQLVLFSTFDEIRQCEDIFKHEWLNGTGQPMTIMAKK